MLFIQKRLGMQSQDFSRQTFYESTYIFSFSGFYTLIVCL